MIILAKNAGKPSPAAPARNTAGNVGAAKAPKSEEWKRKLSEITKKNWENGTLKRPVWTDEKIAEMSALKAQGKTDRECAAVLGVTINAVRDARKRGRTDPRFAQLAALGA